MAGAGSFEEFYGATAGRLLGQLFLVTGDLHAAEEVVQEAFARAAVRWPRLRAYDLPEAWVRRVAMHLAADRARGLRRQARALLRLGPPPTVPAVAGRQARRAGGGAVPHMSDLRERLREAAEAAAQEGHLPAAAAVIARGRRRRVRLLAGTAVLVVLATVAGVVGADLLGGRPAPLAPTPTVAPPTTVWIPSVTPLKVMAHPGPYPGPDPGGIVRDVTSLVRGCHGSSSIRLWRGREGRCGWWPPSRRRRGRHGCAGPPGS